MPISANQTNARSAALSWQRNLLWTSGGTVVYAACTWATLSAIAKLGSAEMVGEFALALAVATPVLMLAQMNLRAVLATDARGEYHFHDYRRLRVNASVLALLVLAGIAWAGYGTRTAGLIFLVGLGLAVEGVSDIYYGLMQRHERMDRITLSLLLRAPLGLAAMVAGISLGQSVMWGALGLFAVRLVVLLAYDASRGSRDFLAAEAPELGGGASSWSQQWAIFAVALPLGSVMVLNSLCGNLPRYFIEHHLGTHELGIFSAAASLISIGSTLINTVGQSVTPRLAKLFAWEGRGAFASFSFRLVGFGVLLAACAVACAATIGRPVLSLMFRPEYGEHVPLLVALMAAGGIGYVSSLLGFAVTAARSFRPQMPLFAVVTVVTLVASAALIPSRGLDGAAMVLAISSATQLVGLAFIFVRVIAKGGTVSLAIVEPEPNA